MANAFLWIGLLGLLILVFGIVSGFVRGTFQTLEWVLIGLGIFIIIIAIIWGLFTGEKKKKKPCKEKPSCAIELPVVSLSLPQQTPSCPIVENVKMQKEPVKTCPINPNINSSLTTNINYAQNPSKIMGSLTSNI